MAHRGVVISIIIAGGCGGGDADVRSLGAAEGRMWGARFSPDSTTLAVAYGDDDRLGTIPVAGGAITELADNSSYLTGTAWTAAGDAIYYDGSGGVYRVAPGSPAAEINDAFASMGVDLSPDGTRLAYGINGTDARVYTIATATETPLDRPCQAIRFAPGGAEVACISGGALVTIDLGTGTATTIVADGVPFIAGVDWYADGQRLVFTSEDGIETVTRAGSRSRLIDSFAAIELDLSPDEKSLVFLNNGSSELSILAL